MAARFMTLPFHGVSVKPTRAAARASIATPEQRGDEDEPDTCFRGAFARCRVRPVGAARPELASRTVAFVGSGRPGTVTDGVRNGRQPVVTCGDASAPATADGSEREP